MSSRLGILLIQEIDGSPDFAIIRLKVDNNLLTDNGDGSATLDIGGVFDTKTIKATYFATVSSGTTTGTITKPAGTNATLIMDEWGTATDAILSTMENGKPTFISPRDASGNVVTTTFDTSGNYTFSATPSPAADHAIIFVYTATLGDFLVAETLGESELVPATLPKLGINGTATSLLHVFNNDNDHIKIERTATEYGLLYVKANGQVVLNSQHALSLGASGLEATFYIEVDGSDSVMGATARNLVYKWVRGTTTTQQIEFKGQTSEGEFTYACFSGHNGITNDNDQIRFYVQNTILDGNLGVKTTTPDAVLQVVGDAKFGEDTTNYTSFAADGELTLSGNARVKKVIFVDLTKMKLGVGNPPGETVENGFLTFDFAASAEEEMFTTFFGPLDWDPISDATFHFAFFVDTASVAAANVVWGIEYKSIAIDGIFDFTSGTSTVTSTVAITTGTPANDKKVHTAVITIPYTDLIGGGLLMARIFRDATNGSDTFTGDARLFDEKIEYIANKLGENL